MSTDTYQNGNEIVLFNIYFTSGFVFILLTTDGNRWGKNVNRSKSYVFGIKSKCCHRSHGRHVIFAFSKRRSRNDRSATRRFSRVNVAYSCDVACLNDRPSTRSTEILRQCNSVTLANHVPLLSSFAILIIELQFIIKNKRNLKLISGPCRSSRILPFFPPFALLLLLLFPDDSVAFLFSYCLVHHYNVVEIEDGVWDMWWIVFDRKQIVESHNWTTCTLVHEPVAECWFVVEATEIGRRLRRQVSALWLCGLGHRPSPTAR